MLIPPSKELVRSGKGGCRLKIRAYEDAPEKFPWSP